MAATLVVALGGGFVIGELLADVRNDNRSMPELAQKAVDVTSKSLPAPIGEGWQFARLATTPSGLVAHFEHAPFVTSEERVASIELVRAPMAGRMCAHEWTARIIDKGGVLELRFVAGVGGGPVEVTSFPLDAAACAPQ